MTTPRRSEYRRDTGELLVRVARVDTTILKVSLRYRWIVTFDDGRVGYVRSDEQANWFRWHLAHDVPLVVTLDEQPHVFGLPPLIVEAASFDDVDDEPF